MSAVSTRLREQWRLRDQVYQVGEEANEGRVSPRKLAAHALHSAMAFTGATAGAIALVTTRQVRLIAREGLSAPSGAQLPSEFAGSCEVSRVFSGETVVLNPRSDHDTSPSILAVPLRACGKVVGALIIAKPGIVFVEERRALTVMAACIGPRLVRKAGKRGRCP